MRGLLLIIFIVLLIILILYTAKSSNNKPRIQEQLNALDKAKIVDVDARIRNITHALESYYFDHNEYPEILDLLLPNYLKLKNDLCDPWGTGFKIEIDEEMNLMLISAGKDKVFGNADDIKRRM